MATAAATRVRSASVATPAVSGTVTPLPGAAQGIDISSHNAEPSWTALKQGGVSFVAIKATEGDYYVNTATTTPVKQPGYATEVTDATNAGMYVMPYAFANPYQGTTAQPGNGSGTCQADYAWQEISSVTSPAYSSSGRMLPVVLDIEQDPYTATESNSNSCYGLSPSQLVAWIGQFLTEMQSLTGKAPVLYTNPGFWSACTGNSTAFSSYPLWLADYGIASPPALPGWGSPAMWQYTDAGTAAGETVDEDYLTPLKQGSTAGKPVTPVQVRTLSTLASPGQAVTWSASGLPSGLQIDAASGVISGTPAKVGSYLVTATATPSTGTPSTVSFQWDVTASPITITPQASQSTVLGFPVSIQIKATDPNTGTSGPAFSATGLPPGTSISAATGLISGWPSALGSYSVKVTATDGLGASASTSFTRTITAAADSGTVGSIRQNGGSGKCLDDPKSRTASASVIDLASCTGKPNQSWTAVKDGSIRLLAHCLGASGTRVYLYACNSTSAEQWRAGTDGALVSVRYGTCLTGPTRAVANGTVPTLATCTSSTTSTAQHWSRPVAPVVSGVASRCLKVSGTSVTFATCVKGYTNQQWTLRPSGTITVQSSGKCLTGSATAGSALIQSTCVKGSPNQQWRLVAAGAIAVELKNPQSGRCVTVPSASSPGGTALVMGGCSTALTSTWRVA
jgi:GH25 family lysozyme M1 (1,4-beta-N-acetylmuramidase)